MPLSLENSFFDGLSDILPLNVLSQKGMKNATTTTQIEDYTVNYKLTTLERCLMIWCNASLPGDAISVNLGKDWAVATPANQHIPCVSTNVLRWSNLNDMAASISRRLGGSACL